MNRFRALVAFELGRARRARTLAGFAAGFALACLAISLVGLSASGAVQVQGFARTSMSLMQLVLWLVPLSSLLIGSSIGAGNAWSWSWSWPCRSPDTRSF